MKRINLIPVEARKEILVIKARLINIVAYSAIFSICLISWQKLILVNYEFNIQLQKRIIMELQPKRTKAIHDYEQIKISKEKNKNERKEISKRLTLLQESKKERIANSRVLVELSQLVSPSIRLKRIVFHKDTITLNGSALNNEVVSELMDRLDQSKYFKRTGFNFIQKSQTTDKPTIDFEIITYVFLDKFIIGQ